MEIDGLATPLLPWTEATPLPAPRPTKAESLVEAIRSAHEVLGQRELSSTVRTALIAQCDRLVDCLTEMKTAP